MTTAPEPPLSPMDKLGRWQDMQMADWPVRRMQVLQYARQFMIPGYTYTSDALAPIAGDGAATGHMPGRPAGAPTRDAQATSGMAERLTLLSQYRQKALASNSAHHMGAPKISLDTFDWKQGAEDRRRAFSFRDLFLPDASERLEYAGEGMEAVAYRDPASPGFIIKFFPRHDDFVGYGHALDYQARPDGSLRAKGPQTDRVTELIDKLIILNALGLPTEVLGVAREAIVAKQLDVSSVAASEGLAPRVMWDLPLHEVPRGLLGDRNTAGYDDFIVRHDGDWWLLSDLHEFNQVRGSDGNIWIIDLVTSRIPKEVLEAAPRFKDYLMAIEDALDTPEVPNVKQSPP